MFGPLEPGEITEYVKKGWVALEDVAGDVYHKLPEIPHKLSAPAAVAVERSEQLMRDVTGLIKDIGGAAAQKFHSDQDKED